MVSSHSTDMNIALSLFHSTTMASKCDTTRPVTAVEQIISLWHISELSMVYCRKNLNICACLRIEKCTNILFCFDTIHKISEPSTWLHTISENEALLEIKSTGCVYVGPFYFCALLRALQGHFLTISHQKVASNPAWTLPLQSMKVW